MTEFLSWSNSRDAFGVPANMLGSVPEEFYAVVGRVVMVSAIVELRLWDLAQVLDRTKPQHEYAGKSAQQMINCCGELLAVPEFADLRDEGTALLRRIQTAFKDRNTVVHSAWPSPTLETAFAWRPVTANKRLRSDPDFTLHLDTDEAWFRDLILRLVRLVDDLGRFRDRVPTAAS